MTKPNKQKNVKAAKASTQKQNLKDLYGCGKGLWEDDAQEYVNRLREDRIHSAQR